MTWMLGKLSETALKLCRRATHTHTNTATDDLNVESFENPDLMRGPMATRAICSP